MYAHINALRVSTYYTIITGFAQKLRSAIFFRFFPFVSFLLSFFFCFLFSYLCGTSMSPRIRFQALYIPIYNVQLLLIIAFCYHIMMIIINAKSTLAVF